MFIKIVLGGKEERKSITGRKGRNVEHHWEERKKGRASLRGKEERKRITGRKGRKEEHHWEERKKQYTQYVVVNSTL